MTTLLIRKAEIKVVRLPSQRVVKVLVGGQQGAKGDTGADGQDGNEFFTAQATQPIGGNRVLYMRPSGAAIASSDNLVHEGKIIGISVNAVNTEEDVIIRREGVVYDSSWDFAANDFVFLGLNGGVTQDYNSLSGFSLRIGWALSPTSIYFSRSNSIIL